MASQGSESRTASAAARGRRGDLEIQDVSAWILRVGVVSSVAVMLCGLALGFLRDRPGVPQMRGLRFSADFARIFRGCLAGDGPAVIELGILLLVLTPILRVAGSMVLFATEERDWFYTTVTFLVLVIALLSLFVLR